MQDLIPINLVVGDRTYRLRVEPADEELVRKAIKTINEKVIEYKTSFAGKDMQDYIAMVLLWYATEHKKMASNTLDLSLIDTQLQQLAAQIQETIK